MTTTAITWQHGAEVAEGGVAATLAMDREAWEKTGATFVQVDDGDGDEPGLAIDRIDVDDQPTQFAILDYATDGTTLMVVAGDPATRPALTARIIEELLGSGAIPSRACVLEIVGLNQEALTDVGQVNAHVADLQRQVRELQAVQPASDDAVRDKLERVADEVSGVLKAARDVADEIVIAAKREAEEHRARAAHATAVAEERVHELDLDTGRIWAERERIVADAKELAKQLNQLDHPITEHPPSDTEPQQASPIHGPPEAGRTHPERA